MSSVGVVSHWQEARASRAIVKQRLNNEKTTHDKAKERKKYKPVSMGRRGLAEMLEFTLEELWD